MDIKFQKREKAGLHLDCLILPTFSDTPLASDERLSAELSWLAKSAVADDHTGEKNQITVGYAPAGAFFPRIILTGMGAKASLSPEAFRLAIAGAMRRCKDLRLDRPALLLSDMATIGDALQKNRADMLREAVVAALLGIYTCTEFRSAAAKTEGKNRDSTFFVPNTLTILHDERVASRTWRDRVRIGEAEAAGVRLARDLVNTPANLMPPSRLADEALALARRYGFSCRVLSRAEITKLRMGALLAVGSGSHKDVCCIILEHRPAKGKMQAPLVLAGKGITFDSGGISLKPSADMHRMKGDMAGAAAVLGVFEAIGHFAGNMPRHVVGIIPCAENMPGGNAARPGDIVTTMSGKTVEILNTDAEGRLILCDALTYAQKFWKPAAIVDIATLTGACVVALGAHGAGLFTDHPSLRDALLSLGAECGDILWHMPLWESLRVNLESNAADIANAGSREGGAITAALFLKSFVDARVPWAHLDIAGLGYAPKGNALCPGGGTGFGVRILYALARNFPDNA